MRSCLASCLLGLLLAGCLSSPELREASQKTWGLMAEKKYEEAEPYARRAVALSRAEYGPDSAEYAELVADLAAILRVNDKYGESIPLYEEALAVTERLRGPDDIEVALVLGSMGMAYEIVGRHEDALKAHERALAIRSRLRGPDHSDIASSLHNLANLYRNVGRTEEAELHYRRALAIWEKAAGRDHDAMGIALSNLATLYRIQGRNAEAEPLLRRYLAIVEAQYPPDSHPVASALSHLAVWHNSQGNAAEAEALYRRTLAIWEKVHGPDRPSVAGALANIALLQMSQGRHAEAELLLRRALAIQEKAWGPDHPATAWRLNNLADAAAGQGRDREAEQLYRRSIDIWTRSLGPGHRDTAHGHDKLAAHYRKSGRKGEALSAIRRATASHAARPATGTGGQAEQRAARPVYLRHLAILVEQASATDGATGEGLRLVQLARASDAASAVSRMAARFASGDGALAGRVREHQDVADALERAEAGLVRLLSQPAEARDETAEATLRDKSAALRGRLDALRADLARNFPGYAELVSPRPLDIGEAQRLLGPDEALLAFAVAEEEAFVVGIRHDRALFRRAAVGADDLAGMVARLRRSLDPSGIRSEADLFRFPADTSHDLYQLLIGPVAPLLDGAGHVFVVPDGALQSLPLGVLLTRKPGGPLDSYARLGEAPWLARTHALSVLPSVSALRALRILAGRAGAPLPFRGIGDPLLKGHPGTDGPAATRAVHPVGRPAWQAPARNLRLAALYRGSIADLRALREVPALPETAGELNALARASGADSAALLLREHATEAALRRDGLLGRSRILAFATHGVIAGELPGLAEPALILTPPAGDEAKPDNDGLLTASEIATTLQLDADWVILSACNTASPDGKPGAEGLSGLAKAFFYAGARALFVSHWPVASLATVELTTRMLDEMTRHPEIGRAEAHRRAMRAMMADAAEAMFAHPMFWAPFVVVGEGGTFRPG